MITDLNHAMDSSIPGREESSTQQEILYLDLPTEVWQQFVQYCKQNELDLSQMIREAVASYYLDFLQILKGRVKIDSSDKQHRV